MKEIIKGYRERTGMNQTEMARKLEITQSHVSKLERGQVPLTPAVARNVQKKLKLSPEEIKAARKFAKRFE